MEDQADILFGLVMVGGFAVLIALLVSAIVSKSETKKECKPHKWGTEKETNKFKCKECGYVAGSHETERGEY